MGDLEWIKSDKDLQEKYDKFKLENKAFANKYDSYDRFSDELIGSKKPEGTSVPDEKENKQEPEKK